MPRKLPWLEEGSKKKETEPPAAPRPKRSSPPHDLVTSDLDDPDDAPKPKTRQVVREPSSSPPPAATGPPPIEYMREGLAGDDVFMMVEDEFYSTAQAFTQHIHHAEYMRLKTLHRSRGRDTLAQLRRGADDGRIEQSKQLRLKLEAKQNKKMRVGMCRQAHGDGESSDEDEFMHDPQLAGLMTGSHTSAGQNLAKLGKARTGGLATAGSPQSPHQPSGVRDVPAEGSSAGRRTGNGSCPVEDADGHVGEDDETDSDDLDTRPSKSRRVYDEWASNLSSGTTRQLIERDEEEELAPAPKPEPKVFRQFAVPSIAEPNVTKQKPPPREVQPPRNGYVEANPRPSPLKPVKENGYASLFDADDDDDAPAPPRAIQPVRVGPSQKEAEKKKADEDSIPIFLF